ncbi:MAG: hypothetical protein ACREQN_06560, partial [Candidatus Binataceae bacterium]
MARGDEHIDENIPGMELAVRKPEMVEASLLGRDGRFDEAFGIEKIEAAGTKCDPHSAPLVSSCETVPDGNSKKT